MSNDLLPWPDILAASPKQTDHDSEAEEAPVNGSGHRLLTEYPNFDSRLRTNGVVGPIDCLDATPREEPVSPAAGLADVAARIRQIEAGLQANDVPASEIHSAVERIHDLAVSLRMREVDAALCDTLEASAGAVDDAVARTEAAVARTQNAAALLRDLARRIDQIVMRIPDGACGPESAGPPADIEAGNEFTRTNGSASLPTAQPVNSAQVLTATQTFNGSQAVHGAPAINDFVLDDDQTLPQPSFVHPALPEMQALAEPNMGSAERTGPIVLSMPGPLGDENIEAVPANDWQAQAAHEPAAVEAEGRDAAASVSRQAEQSITAAPQSAAMNAAAPANSPKPATSPMAADDPLTAVYALSEEELIALFS